MPATASRLSTGVYDWNSGKAGTLEIPVDLGTRTAAEEKQSSVAVHTQDTATEINTAPQPETAMDGVAAANAPNGPALRHRPPPSPAVQKISEGQIQLDVAVSDADGKPVTGLQPWDFKLTDNDQSRKIMSFRAFNDAEVRPNPPVEVILVIDELNLLPQQVAFVRDEVEQYLRRNNGRLDHPVSLMLISDAGLRVQPRPLQDGNTLAKVVKGISAHVSTISPAMGGEGDLERFQRSVQQLETIAENEANKPGRKLLIWIGPGWPLLERAGNHSTERDQRLYFDGIVELSTKLREARIVVNSVSPADATSTAGEAYRLVFKQYLKGVRTAHDADSGNLSLKVIATQTGGLVLGPDNDLVEQIDRCVANADAFYRISFNPPPAGHADEYHDLRVEVNQAGLNVRTNSGYYEQPSNP